MGNFGKSLIVMGLLLTVAGLVICFNPKLPTWLGKLPGDFAFKRGNFSFYFPLATCLLISAILSFVLWLFKK